MPSHAYTAWEQHAGLQIAVLKRKIGDLLPITVPVNCRAIFYRDALRGDAVGYYQALADCLEKHGVVENDNLIVSWDGSVMDRSDHPGVVVILDPIKSLPGPPKEQK